jgi:ParB family chromosome partitioning protein
MPTAAGYFDHVSKAKALEAVSVFAPDQLTRLSKLKKADLAAEAERLSAGKGWLPAMLCAAPVGDAATEGASKELGACGGSDESSVCDGE